jgi:hypothetical protein
MARASVTAMTAATTPTSASVTTTAIRVCIQEDVAGASSERYRRFASAGYRTKGLVRPMY